GVEPLVSGAGRRREGTDPPDRHRGAGPQTPRRLVALCHPRRRSRGRRVQGGMTRWLNPIPAKPNATASPDPGGRRPRINPRAETRREKGWSRQPEPDALEHEGLWSEPTSSTGCEVMRAAGLQGKDGLTRRIHTHRNMHNAEMNELDRKHPRLGWSRQPEPDALEHEGLWSEPTSSTGCEV